MESKAVAQRSPWLALTLLAAFGLPVPGLAAAPEGYLLPPGAVFSADDSCLHPGWVVPVVVPGDPTADISVLQQAALVMRGGVIYKQPQ